jgi:DNA-binding transcriptional MerR regulator
VKNYFAGAKVGTKFATDKYRLYSILYLFLLKFEKAMLINELSGKTGVTIHTLRYYENLGLIQGMPDKNVKTNNYKNYDETVIERLEIIAEAKEVGYTLSEIKEILDGWFDGTLTPKKLQKLFSTKISEIEAKIRQLKQVKKRLEKMMKETENGLKC